MEKPVNSAQKSTWQNIPLKKKENLAAILSSLLQSKLKETNNEFTSQNTAYSS